MVRKTLPQIAFYAIYVLFLVGLLVRASLEDEKLFREGVSERWEGSTKATLLTE